eukprot:1159441-Pelagomonas_calceolata.AAC.7
MYHWELLGSNPDTNSFKCLVDCLPVLHVLWMFTKLSKHLSILVSRGHHSIVGRKVGIRTEASISLNMSISGAHLPSGRDNFLQWTVRLVLPCPAYMHDFRQPLDVRIPLFALALLMQFLRVAPHEMELEGISIHKGDLLWVPIDAVHNSVHNFTDVSLT